ncbi:hypothetical protein [Lentzea jiangxiensis]|uniref:Uncharacterized protein n=1 Tax=Lentzea jiangxiensis TaxID=641025 RepID=A0A1H0WSK9_9PSEU|nr:hypothetical protein [Lentzea jiangxiensis]SDP93678.1 hypothetical protein SAMN05421507_12278 [Lentzea jiangxiensis]
MGKSRSATSIRSLYEADLRKAYGDVAAPRRDFAREMVKRDPYSALLLDLSATGETEDDTDINHEVAFTYFVRGSRLLLVKLSMVGPYAVVLAFGEDGCGAGELLSRPAGPFESRVLDLVQVHGLRLVPVHHLETPVPLAVVPGRDEVTLYAALFEPEAEPPWW